jgi:phospholipid/cholesterol/gamma-HCH transport system permease protein
MTAVVLAGRTGAAYAAHLGSMQVSEEIDALRTIGLDPMDFLVLPRAAALIVMTPLLTLYANVLGILGGMLVSVATLRGVTAQQYMAQTSLAMGPKDLLAGLVMAAVFGVLVAHAGCQRGMESGKSAQAVGKAATSAVVTAIVLIVVACAVLTYVFTELGI